MRLYRGDGASLWLKRYSKPIRWRHLRGTLCRTRLNNRKWRLAKGRAAVNGSCSFSVGLAVAPWTLLPRTTAGSRSAALAQSGRAEDFHFDAAVLGASVARVST